MAKRIFVEKKIDFNIKSQSLLQELTHHLQLQTMTIKRLEGFQWDVR